MTESEENQSYLHCDIANRKCRHIGINYKLVKIPVVDKLGYPELLNGIQVEKVEKVGGKDREYCNSYCEYIKDMTECRYYARKIEQGQQSLDAWFK
jgi:hypothetical protein